MGDVPVVMNNPVEIPVAINQPVEIPVEINNPVEIPEQTQNLPQTSTMINPEVTVASQGKVPQKKKVTFQNPPSTDIPLTKTGVFSRCGREIKIPKKYA